MNPRWNSGKGRSSRGSWSLPVDGKIKALPLAVAILSPRYCLHDNFSSRSADYEDAQGVSVCKIAFQFKAKSAAGRIAIRRRRREKR